MSLSALSSPLNHTYISQRNRYYVPQTPSPLRTSRNANLMPPPSSPRQTLTATPDSKTLSSSFTTPDSSTSISSTFDFGSTTSSTRTSASALPFQFQSRSRSQSPQASLARSNAAAKVRRSSLFLDKVRQKREDSRFETRGEQALRMDFVRERRAWEERLKRRAPSFEVEVDDTITDEVDQDMGVQCEQVDAKLVTDMLRSLLDGAVNDETTIPSPTEDREIEELLSYLEADGTQSIGGRTNNASLSRDSHLHLSKLDNASDDEDYDQLFMEVMADDLRMSQVDTGKRDVWCEPRQDQESSMDLS